MHHERLGRVTLNITQHRLFGLAVELHSEDVRIEGFVLQMLHQLVVRQTQRDGRGLSAIKDGGHLSGTTQGFSMSGTVRAPGSFRVRRGEAISRVGSVAATPAPVAQRCSPRTVDRRRRTVASLLPARRSRAVLTGANVVSEGGNLVVN